MIKVQSNYCEVFGRNHYGTLEILFGAFNCSNSMMNELVNKYKVLGYSEIEALRGGEPIILFD